MLDRLHGGLVVGRGASGDSLHVPLALICGQIERTTH